MHWKIGKISEWLASMAPKEVIIGKIMIGEGREINEWFTVSFGKSNLWVWMGLDGLGKDRGQGILGW